MEQVVQQYHATVRPMHNLYVAPSGKTVANLIVHADAQGLETFDIACAVLTNHLRSVTEQHHQHHQQQRLLNSGENVGAAAAAV
jgi:uridine kinase